MLTAFIGLDKIKNWTGEDKKKNTFPNWKDQRRQAQLRDGKITKNPQTNLSIWQQSTILHSQIEKSKPGPDELS